MTLLEFEQYKTLVRTSYMNYVLDMYNRAQVSKLDMQFEFDTKLWILGKAISIIFDYELTDYNHFTVAEMLQWQDIMNDIMKTRRYVDFIVE